MISSVIKIAVLLIFVQDGSVSEEEANFFLSGNEQFDRETFLSVGYALLKPYIDLEESEPSSVVEIPEVEKEMPIEDPNDAAAQDPQVYDPWRANQHKVIFTDLLDCINVQQRFLFF